MRRSPQGQAHAVWALPSSFAPASNLGFWSACGAIVSNGRFMGFSLIAAIAFTCHFSFIAISPVIFLDDFGLTQLQFSVVLLIYGAAYVIGGVIASRLQKVINHQQQLKVGLGLISLAGVALIALHLTTERSLLTILLPMMLCTTGTTITRPAAVSRAMDLFLGNAGAAASMLNTTVFVTGGVISALASVTVANFEYALASGFVGLSAIGWTVVRQIYSAQPPA